MRTLRMLAVLAPTLAAGACVIVDPLSPSWTSGTFHVYSANGQGIPAVVLSQGGSNWLTVRLTGGELRLRGDETFRLELDFVESDRHSDVYYTQIVTGTWDRGYDEIWLRYPDSETGVLRVAKGFRSYDQLEVTLRGFMYGANVHLALDR